MTREHEPATENLCRQEAQEYLNAIHDALLDLFEDADSASIDRRLDGVLSSVRSLRGEAEEAQWRGIAELSQRLEENLQRIRLYRPQLGLKFQNLWRQAIAALRAAIAVQGESPFADRIGVEARAAEALDRLELHFTEVPAGNDHWAELEHCLRLLESLRGGWQEVAEAQADLVAVQESLAELGLAIPEVGAIGQWLEEAAASCQELTQWQELGEQTIQRLQEALGTGDSSGQSHGNPGFGTPHLLDFPGEGPFEFPDVNDTELFAQEDNTGTADPFAWFEPTAETPTDFLQDVLAGGDGETLASLSKFGGEEETEHGSDLYPTQELNLWGEDQSPDQEAPEFGVGGGDPLQEEGVALIPEGLGDLNFWEETTTIEETKLSNEPDFPATTTEEPPAAGLEDLGFWEEPTAAPELGNEPDFPATTTEEPPAAGLEDLGFWEEPTAAPELGNEPDFPTATTEEPPAAGLEDLGFWEEPTAAPELGNEPDFPTATTEEPPAAGLEDLGFWEEPTAAPELGNEPDFPATTTEEPPAAGLEDLGFWEEPTAAPELGNEPDFPAATTEEPPAAGLEDLGFWEEPTAAPELGNEPDFPTATTEEPPAAGLEDLGFWEEPTAAPELGNEPDFPAATTEEPPAAGLEDLGFWEEPTAAPELGNEPDFPAATTEEPPAAGLGDLTFWREAGYDAGLVADMETMAEALAGLDSWREPVSPPPDSSEETFPVREAERVGGENPEISLDGLLIDPDATLPDMNDLSAMVSLESLTQSWEVQAANPELSTALSDGDLTDLEQTLAMSEFEALNFELSDDVGDEIPSLLVPGLGNQLSDLAATFDGEPPALPKVQSVSRPIFSGMESVVFTAMEPVSTDFPGDPWSTQTLYDVAADLGAGQIVLNWQLQQLRTAVRSLLSSTRNLGTTTEATPETAFPDGILPEGLLRLREISEDIDLALFEMEQTNADRQRQIWQVQELARDERLCTLGSLGQQLVQGLTSVQLIVENSTVALDRTFMNKLAEPLADLLKLLADCSLEEPAERQRLGKPVVGTLRIRGVAVGDTLNLEITDDGAGLPFDIFQPGAPGAPIAHRCQALGIALRPDFTTGRGSRINLQLPYVLLMTRVLLLRIGPAMVAVRAEHVRDILVAPPGDSRTVIWGHRTIPWINPQDRFQVNCRRQELPVFEKPDQENVLVVLQSGDHQYALAVDACWREQEATLQRLAGGMPLSFPFCGCAVLTDGRVIPLFAPAEMLFQPNEDNTQLRLLEKQKRQSAREILTRRSPQLILLVDDSINVRRYLASVLESAGFATVQARDGLEALEKLDNGLQPGAIISDLEMPRMDGYTLLRRVRSREICRNIPFVVLTSRTNERHRQQAEELGATAYVNKPYRNEEIVSLVQRLTATER